VDALDQKARYHTNKSAPTRGDEHFGFAGHFVSYRWVSGPHNVLVILWNLLKTKKNVHQQKQTGNEVQDCWSRLNASLSHEILLLAACSSPLTSGVRRKFSWGGVWLRVIWWSFVFGVRCLWRHNLTSFPCFQTNVLAKFVDVIMHVFIHPLPLFHVSLHWI